MKIYDLRIRIGNFPWNDAAVYNGRMGSFHYININARKSRRKIIEALFHEYTHFVIDKINDDLFVAHEERLCYKIEKVCTDHVIEHYRRMVGPQKSRRSKCPRKSFPKPTNV